MTTYARGRIAAAALTAALAGAGCASGSKIPDQEVADVELSIRAAENATATQHAKALLDRSLDFLDLAANETRAGAVDRGSPYRLPDAFLC